MTAQERGGVPVTAFGTWMRTGRRIEGVALEVKFNPWHDPENGRFTFVGQGNYFPRGWQRSSAQGSEFRAGESTHATGGGGAHGGWVDKRDPAGPGNYIIYTVRHGDTLASIAATRKGLSVSDLALINNIKPGALLRAGQTIKLWNQDFLDRVSEDRRRIVALGRTAVRGGEWPPSLVNLRPIQRDVLDANWRRETRDTYDYWIDALGRSREIFGQLSWGRVSRSRVNQARAGQPDRRPTDDGGHFIGIRFNAPRDAFNHFAQDANFNRGAYRRMENGWAAELRAGRKVFVSIKPLYAGTSKRPYHITVAWSINGQPKRVQEFSNEVGGRPHAKR